MRVWYLEDGFETPVPPEKRAGINFQLADEHRLSGWQSGVLWADGTRKPSYATLELPRFR